MGSVGIENGGVASLGGASNLVSLQSITYSSYYGMVTVLKSIFAGFILVLQQVRIKNEPLPELLPSAISQVLTQTDSTNNQSSSPHNTEFSIQNETNIQNYDKNGVVSIENQFDHRDATTKLMEFGERFKASDIDTGSTATVAKLLELRQFVKSAVVLCKRGKVPDPELWKKVNLFLYIVSHMGTVTPEVSKDLYLKQVLELFTNPNHKCPSVYSEISKALIKEIEAQNGFEAPLSHLPPITTHNKKRKSVDETPNSFKRSRESPISSPSGYSAPPASANDIWGDNGIMRGILWKEGGHLMLDKDKRDKFRKEWDHFGHNGLTVGDCWPKQMAALRDGAHGAPQAGIVGDKDHGAYSIVISKHYEGFDTDLGDTVYYSAPGAKESTSKEPDTENTGAMALRRSIETKKPVRVLRSANCAWKDGPTAGIRYDGLYQVTDCNIKTNAKGGRFWQFILKRMLRVNGRDQDPIDLKRPTKKEIGLFEKAREGY